MKNNLVLFFIILLSVVSYNAFGQKNYKFKFQDPSLSIDERVDDLLSRLTLEEKMSQMMHLSPSIDRLGIPTYNWANEALHGIGFNGMYKTTVFPQVIGLAAGFDREDIRKMGHMIAIEGRAVFNDAQKKGYNHLNYMGITFWTPNINIVRDPRWGRGQETYGEDPFLSGELGKAMVRGLQGNDSLFLLSSACAKHYAVHSGPESLRNSFDVKVSNYDLWNTYLPAFRELVVDGKVSSVMGAYNRYDCIPCCANHFLMEDILYNTWNFDGYVVSDCNAIEDIYLRHKYAVDAKEASALAVRAGTNVECGNQYSSLKEAYNQGLVTEADINKAVKRLLRIRFRLGMFDENIPENKIGTDVLACKEHDDYATYLARRSMVLLENKGNILPLEGIRKMAVIGPNSDNLEVLLGNYHGFPPHAITVLDGIKSEAAKHGIEVFADKASSIMDNSIVTGIDFNSWVNSAGETGFKASYYDNLDFAGQPVKVEDIKGLPSFVYGDQTANVIPGHPFVNVGICYESKFKPDRDCNLSFDFFADDALRIYINGESLGEKQRFNGRFIVPVKKDEIYRIKIEYEQYGGGGRLEMRAGSLIYGSPERTCKLVDDCDVVVYVGGINTSIESEGTDRNFYDLPEVQKKHLRALKDCGKKVVLVILSGSSTGLAEESRSMDAILQAWYPGQNGGRAVADVLFGNYNPSGHLPETFYKSLDDLGEFTDYNMSERTYRYFEGDVVYPFGYGLSYTNFEFTKMKISNVRRCGDDTELQVQVKNCGQKDGDAVVQVYIKHPGMKEIVALKDFKRVYVPAGKTVKVNFNLPAKVFAFSDDNGNVTDLPGSVELIISDKAPVGKWGNDGNVIRTTIKSKGKPHIVYKGID